MSDSDLNSVWDLRVVEANPCGARLDFDTRRDLTLQTKKFSRAQSPPLLNHSVFVTMPSPPQWFGVQQHQLRSVSFCLCIARPGHRLPPDPYCHRCLHCTFAVTSVPFLPISLVATLLSELVDYCTLRHIYMYVGPCPCLALAAWCFLCLSIPASASSPSPT